MKSIRQSFIDPAMGRLEFGFNFFKKVEVKLLTKGIKYSSISCIGKGGGESIQITGVERLEQS